MVAFVTHMCKKLASMSDGDPVHWMKALPLCHFLKDQSEPFGKQDMTISMEREEEHGLKLARIKAARIDK